DCRAIHTSDMMLGKSTPIQFEAEKNAAFAEYRSKILQRENSAAMSAAAQQQVTRASLSKSRVFVVSSPCSNNSLITIVNVPAGSPLSSVTGTEWNPCPEPLHSVQPSRSCPSIRRRRRDAFQVAA